MVRKSLLRISMLAMLLGGNLYGQDIAGAWQRALKGGSHELRLVVTIAKENSGGWKATMTSGDDPASSTEVTTVMLEDSNLRLAISSLGATYEGRISSDGTFIVGIWRRHSHEMPLVLRRVTSSNGDLRK